MFIVVQLPFADVRGLMRDQAGRVETPDWSADAPGRAFIRGFGKLAARNAKSFGLLGERYFADFDNAVRLRKILALHQDDWPFPLEAELRFRRLYFDGRLAGRFEFGFVVPDLDEERLALKLPGLTFDPRRLAGQALASPIDVLTPGLDPVRTTIGQCADALGHAYLAATTRQKALDQFPPGELYGQAVALGPPLVHIRLSNNLPADVGRDRAEAEGSDGLVFFTSAQSAAGRNNVLVQLSGGGSQAEDGDERATRVLFAHLHALLYAQGHFLTVRDKLDLGQSAPLLDAVGGMIRRLGHFEPSTPKADNDKAFARAMGLWGDRYTGRAEELTQRLNAVAAEASKPGAWQKSLDWMNAIFQVVVKTGVEAAVKIAAKPM